MNVAVEAIGLTKRYRVYPGPRSLLREMLWGGRSHQLIQALQDVTFSIPSGQAFGVVGENGAGKSTLLKILTGTTFPTEGNYTIEGNVSALLELGAGFHPEFSGRKNIYFSGALMGLSRQEIKACEEEIIAFSELEKVIDLPVRTYSSGMYLRLGFAVATGFQPSILIVDEALAVGDQRFQKKCTDRILTFRRLGRTILFCSHNLYQVKNLCDQALWLRRGEVAALGPALEVVDRFADHLREEPSENGVGQAGPSASCQIEKVRIVGADGLPRELFEPDDVLSIEVWASFAEEFEGRPGIGIGIARNDETLVYETSTAIDSVALSRLEDGRYYCCLTLPELRLLSGSYHCIVFAAGQDDGQPHCGVQRRAHFVITNPRRDIGLVRLQHEWEE